MSIPGVTVSQLLILREIQTMGRQTKTDSTEGGLKCLIRPDDLDKPGDTVENPVLGIGLVTAIRIGEGSKAVCVKFEEIGTKWIVPDQKYL